MTRAIARAIRSYDSDVLQIFTSKFKTLTRWRRYFLDNYAVELGDDEDDGTTFSIYPILSKQSLEVTDFHALFIACWVHYPVEKGSYMIKLTGSQRRHVRKGYDKLGYRISSHYSGHGRSAGAGWKFLEGYTELLVQMEGGGKNSPGEDKYVFLKCEGHPAVSVPHIKSYFYKKKHGVGMTANEELHELGHNNMYGIRERSAENFSGRYEAFLRYTGAYAKSKKVTTIRAATKALLTKMNSVLTYYYSLPKTLRGLFVEAGFAKNLRPKDIMDFSNEQLASFLSDVIVPFISDIRDDKYKSGQYGDNVLELVDIVSDAIPDLMSIADKLREDVEVLGEEFSDRHFEEVRLHPDTIDRSLRRFYRTLTRPQL